MWGEPNSSPFTTVQRGHNELKLMKASEIILSIGAGLSLVLTSQAQPTTNTLDWNFSFAGNPSPINASGTTNTSGGTPTATFVGNNNTYFFNTTPLGGANGYFGARDGLWDVNNGELDLSLNRTAPSPVNYWLVITQFIDNQLYPGTVGFSVPNAQFVNRNVVVPQSGNMGGFWAADTYSWTGVSLPGTPVTMNINPGTIGTALLLDDVQFTISGVLIPVPEPGISQIAAVGLIAFGMVSWFRRTRNA